MREQLGYMKLCSGTGKEPVKSLCIKISRQTNMVAFAVGICYRPPDQEEVVAEVFF